MAFSPITLDDTFDTWRVRTNQVILALAAAESNVSNVGTVTSAAYEKANSANFYAYQIDANTKAAFEKANTGGTISYAAYDKANSANYFAYLVNINATAAFAQANAASLAASASYDKANVAGGGFYKGNNGDKGLASNKNDIFRVNNNYIGQNLYFSSNENASATGPLTVNTGIVLTINSGARVVIL